MIMSWCSRHKLTALFPIVLCLMAIWPGTTALADDRLHHTIDLALDPSSGTIEIVDVIDVSGHDQLALKLAEGLAVESVKIDGETATPSIEAGVSWITLPSSDDHQVELAYGGRFASENPAGGLSPMILAEGAFLPYGIGWLTNAGAEDDRATYVLNLSVPDPFEIVATGKLVDEAREDGRYLATFSSWDRPTEPPSIFAGDYRIGERHHGDLRLRTYFPDDQNDLSIAYLDQVEGYIDLFSEAIGDYPYDGFSVIASPLPVGLGFPGLTYVSSRILGMPFMLTRSLAHEIVHNWWANGVFVDYSEGNWAEGLTTYMADYGLAERDDQAAAWQMRLGWLRDYAALPADRDRPINSFRSKGHDADQVVGYNKVAMVFHMLKQELGEEAFNAGLREFWNHHRFEIAGWSDLQASFEAASERDLTPFFLPWLTEKGAPSLSLDRADLRKTDDGFALDLAISSDRPAYELLIPVQIESTESAQEQLIRLSNGKAEVTLDLAERPLSIGIDQRHDLFRSLAEGEAPPILRDVTLATDTLTIVAVNGSDLAREAAQSLAERTLDTGVQLANIDDDAIETAPLMLIGLKPDMPDMLSRAGIEPAPDHLNVESTARSWVANRENAPPALVVEAEDVEALKALIRPLPHYGRQSFLVFNGSKVTTKGVWPTGKNALTRHFD
jgi:hypothetical protein